MQSESCQRRITAFWLLAAAVVLVDQASKLWAQSALPAVGSLEVLPSLLYLTRVANPGAAFGLFARHTLLFVGVSLAVLFLAVFFARRIAAWGWLVRLALALQVGGAAGNLLDRVRFGHVVDFIDFRVWPVFNLADSAIVIGAGLLLLALWNEKPADRGLKNGG
ncbi:MAG: signal peptidase II [Syntrophomonadaceae bacterium]|nr:signal peptidase II [Syntrophomonadaceae bacterium]